LVVIKQNVKSEKCKKVLKMY